MKLHQKETGQAGHGPNRALRRQRKYRDVSYMNNNICRILLVEDDKVDVMAFKWLLEEENLAYDCTVVSSISEARRTLDSKKFDVIVADYSFRDGTAFDIFDLAKDTSIILTTGAGDEEIAVKALKAGACDYLIKDPGRTYLKAIPITIENALKHRKLEEMLDQKQKNLEAIFDAIPVGMLLVDEDMTVKRVNDAIRQMVRKEYSQIINLRVGNALGCINSTHDEKGCGHSPACAACPLQSTIESALGPRQTIHKVDIQPELDAYKKEVAWLCVSAIPVTIDGCKHAVVAIDDITDRKKAEQKLKETMQMKSQFISTVSHELRTPLGCMKEAITIVLEGVAGQISDKQRKFLDIAKRNVDRLARLINSVLDFQKLEAGEIRLNLQDNDIHEVLEEVHQTMTPAAEKQSLNLSLEIVDDLPKAKFDRDKIIQVLTNLVNNAIKFTPERGRISVCVQCQREELVIRVSDTGMGIPKEGLSKIFDRFYRVHRPGKEIQGTGLGLSIVNKIVMMHGGRIEVESEVGKGTTFTVSLPLAPKAEPATLPVESDETLEHAIATN